MQRTIKFRAKRLDTGKWVYGDLNDASYSPKIVDPKEGATYDVDPATVGQYTGEVDKHGKDIYEGDVCDGRYGRFTVRFIDGGFWPLCGEINVPSTPEEREVIGNIHDNPPNS